MTMITRTILITGATSGIGYQSAIKMINFGHNLIIPCRNKFRQETIINKLKNDLINFKALKDNFTLPILDLSDIRSLENFANGLIDRSIYIDSLILNAGLQYTGSKVIKWSQQNIELTFAVNHLSHYYLANRLLHLLLKSNSPRIIVTASEVHNPSLPGGRVGYPASLGNLEGLSAGAGFKMIDGNSSFNADKAYKDTKLCNVLFSKELARRISLSKNNCPVICWAPGLVIPRSNDGFFRYSRKNNEIGQRLFALIARDILKITETPERAGEILAHIEQSKKYIVKPFTYLSNKLIAYSKHRLVESETSLESNDIDKASRLWDLSNDLLEETSDN